MMLRRLAPLALALGAVAGGAAEAQQPGSTAVETLERRVERLEEQNRELLALLEELRAELRRQRADAAATAPAPVDGEAAPGSAPAEAPVTVPSPAPPAIAPAAPSEDEPILAEAVAAGASRLTFYGFVRLDAIYDDSRPDHPQSPTFILSEDPRLGPVGDEQLNFHPRLTRFGMNYSGPRLDWQLGAKLSGKLEIDFQNGGRESRAIPRMRHGWLELAGEDWSLLAGQTWDVISPLYPAANNDSLMWNAGNLGDRRPQVRFGYRPQDGVFSLTGAVGLTGAIDSQDLDADGVRDGDDSTLPNLQVRWGAAGSSADRRGWSLGLSGHYGWEETTVPVAGETRFASHSIGLDYDLDLGERVALRGEAWTGRNLSDFRGGIGQGVDPISGEEIDSRGGWLELGLELSDGYSLAGGFAADDPDDDDLPAGGRTENQAWYLVQRLRVARSFLLGLDYLRWTTEYQGFADGTDNRFNLYLVYDL